MCGYFHSFQKSIRQTFNNQPQLKQTKIRKHSQNKDEQYYQKKTIRVIKIRKRQVNYWQMIQLHNSKLEKIKFFN